MSRGELWATKFVIVATERYYQLSKVILVLIGGCDCHEGKLYASLR